MLRTWIHFFVGTPKRFLTTFGICAAVFFCFRPDILQRALSDLLNAVITAIAPFMGPILSIAIMLAIAGYLFRTVFPHKTKK